MKVLLTGASSFSGMWFAEKLASAGMEVLAPLRGEPKSYAGVRAERVKRLSGLVELAPHCPLGAPRFMDLIANRSIDVFCHHGAQVGDYRSPDFDVSGALAANTLNFPRVLESLSRRGQKAVVATGSVFEQDEGAGEAPLRAFSPYGLSKGLTWQVIRYWCQVTGTPVGKFVIANPIGPFEEARFLSYLVANWLKGEVALVRTPLYLRDNIHVDLLAAAYVDFVKSMASDGGDRRFGPRGYVETQGALAP